MAIKRYKPVTPTQRFKTVNQSDELTTKQNLPEKSLVIGARKKAGRNNYGRITMRRKGGGHKKLYRIIDYLRRDKMDISSVVESIEYDPNRSANIALLCYKDGERRYIISPKGLKLGQEVISSTKVDLSPGNASFLKNLPVGTLVHNIEMQPGRGAQLVRSAGAFAIISGSDKEYIILKFPSGEVRKIHGECFAVVGIVGNIDHNLVKIGKAGRNRWLGKRPKVRGVAMNPIDHPHGGGEGKTAAGRHPVSPWGKLTKGKKTRNVRKVSSRLILSRRK